MKQAFNVPGLAPFLRQVHRESQMLLKNNIKRRML